MVVENVISLEIEIITFCKIVETIIQPFVEYGEG